MGEDLGNGWVCAASRQQGPLVPRETLLGFRLVVSFETGRDPRSSNPATRRCVN